LRDEQTESFVATGQALSYVYFEDEPQRQMSMKRLSRDEAFLVAVNIAKLPDLLRRSPSSRVSHRAIVLRRSSMSGVGTTGRDRCALEMTRMSH